jgi:ATP-binding cassette subfamily B protein
MDNSKPAPRQNAPRHGGFGGPGGGMGGGPAEKPQDFKGTMKKLIAYLHKYWAKMLVVVILTVVSTLFSIVSPKILGEATNHIVDDFVQMKSYDGIMEHLPKGTVLPQGTTGADIIKTMPAEQKSKLTDAQLQSLSTLDLSHRPSFDFTAIRNIMLLLIALYVLSAVFTYILGWIMTDITQKVTYELRRDISHKINRLPLSIR